MKRASLNEMKAVVASFQVSGLTQREFCQQQQIKLPTFSYWYRKVQLTPSTTGGFTEVTVPEQIRGLEVVFPNGVVIRGIGDLSILRSLIKW